MRRHGRAVLGIATTALVGGMEIEVKDFKVSPVDRPPRRPVGVLSAGFSFDVELPREAVDDLLRLFDEHEIVAVRMPRYQRRRLEYFRRKANRARGRR